MFEGMTFDAAIQKLRDGMGIIETPPPGPGSSGKALSHTFITDLNNERNAKAAELFAKLPGFDIEAALAGAPYIHRFDLPKVKPYHDCRRIAEPHSGLLIWVGEWVTYDSTDSGLEELESQLAMYDPAVLG
jgi:hypothetical protein